MSKSAVNQVSSIQLIKPEFGSKEQLSKLKASKDGKRTNESLPIGIFRLSMSKEKPLTYGIQT